MGTRGLYGIRRDGRDKLTYNHFDSYPSGLGKDFLKFCKMNTLQQLHRFYDNIVLVDEDSIPTFEQITVCKKNGYFDAFVSEQKDTDWYCLLRGLQGDFDEYQRLLDKNRTIYMIDNSDFINM